MLSRAVLPSMEWVMAKSPAPWPFAVNVILPVHAQPYLQNLPDTILAEPDADPVAVPSGSIEQNCEVTIKEGMLDETTLNC